MANIVPPVPPSAAGSPPSGSTATPANTPAITVTTPPPGLSQVAIGTAILGTVIPSDLPGTIGIQTPVGTLNVPNTLTVPNNAVLTLLLQALTPHARLLITAINGQPPSTALQTQPGTLPAANAALSTPTSTPSVSVGTAPVITAIILQNAGSGTQPGATPQSSSGTLQGTPGAAATTAGATPGATTGAIGALAQLARSAAAKVGLPSTTGTSGTAPTPTSPGTAPGNPPSTLPSGTQVPVRIVNIQPATPGGATPTPPAVSLTSLSSGQTISGIVTGTTPAGHTLVQTPAGQFSISVTESAPQGSSITFEIAGRPLLPATLSATPTTALDLFSLSREWPALEEALRVLQENHPGIAQQLITMVIPRLDNQLASNILLFLVGLRGGDIRGWLGDETMRALGDTRPGLARQLQAEFGQLSRIAENPPGGDWRQMLIPLNTGDAIEQVHMFMRQNKKEKDGKGDTETRFVIDVGLTQLGRVQLDGLIGEQNKRLDLIIRSHNPLPGTMQNDIRTIYINAGEITGMKGGLSFQAAPPKFVEVPATIPPENPTNGLIA